jgi:hypothetical protein
MSWSVVERRGAWTPSNSLADTPLEKVDPTRYRHGIAPALRLTGFLGFCAGFMLAYQNSSCASCLLLGPPPASH